MEIMVQWNKGDGVIWPVIDRQTGESVGEIRRFPGPGGGYQVRKAADWSSPQAFPVRALALL